MDQDLLSHQDVARNIEPAIAALRDATEPFAEHAPDSLMELAPILAQLASGVQRSLASADDAGDESRATLKSVRAQALYMAKIAEAALANQNRPAE